MKLKPKRKASSPVRNFKKILETKENVEYISATACLINSDYAESNLKDLINTQNDFQLS
jgi:hypothetical protein